MKLGYSRQIGLGQPPEDAPLAPVARGYVAVPTYDVQKFVGDRITTFGMGAILGFGAGAAVAVFFTGMRR